MNIEPLESRIAPASFTYLDADGDNVTIIVSKGPALVLNTHVTLTSGNPATPGMLGILTLTDPAFDGANVSFAVKKAPGGDGLANVGGIDASNVDLGAVTVPGDLGAIFCGDAVTTGDPGLGSLKARSMGAINNGPFVSDNSVITGAIGKLEITRDFSARLETTAVTNNDAGIGKIVIGGDVIGGDAMRSGSIEVEDGCGSVTVRGKIIGGAGEESGHIVIFDDVKAVTLGGLVGGRGEESGRFEMHGPKATVMIKGSVLGGSGEDSGAFECEGAIGTVTVTGAIIGGTGDQSGRLDLDDFKKVTVGSIVGASGAQRGQVLGDKGVLVVRGDVVGGGSFNGGNIDGGSFASVTIGGDLQGLVGVTGHIEMLTIRGSVAGGDISAGSIGTLKVDGNFGAGDSFQDTMFVGDVGKIVIGGSLVGGDSQSGRIESTGTIGELTIRGSVIGTGSDSGYVFAAGIGKLKIGGDIKGGAGNFNSGEISVTGTLGSATIGRSIIGGGGANSGQLSAAGMGPVSIGGDVVGGFGTGSGAVLAGVGMEKVTIRGSLIGGHADDSGSVGAGTQIQEVTIGRDVIGRGFAGTGKISANFITRVTIGGDLVGGRFDNGVARADSGLITAGSIDFVTIRGNLIAGIDDGTVAATGASGAIIAGTLGPVFVGGSIVGNDINHALIIARGLSTKPTTGDDLAIESLTVKGDVLFAEVLAGFSGFDKMSANADASIGPVTVGGDWRASSLVAGAEDAGAAGFGIGDQLQTVDNTALIARIVKVVIAGDVFGTAQNAADHFGFVAERIEAITIAGRKVALDPDPGTNDDLLLSPTGDLRALEVDP